MAGGTLIRFYSVFAACSFVVMPFVLHHLIGYSIASRDKNMYVSAQQFAWTAALHNAKKYPLIRRVYPPRSHRCAESGIWKTGTRLDTRGYNQASLLNTPSTIPPPPICMSTIRSKQRRAETAFWGCDVRDFSGEMPEPTPANTSSTIFSCR